MAGTAAASPPGDTSVAPNTRPSRRCAGVKAPGWRFNFPVIAARWRVRATTNRPVVQSNSCGDRMPTRILGRVPSPTRMPPRLVGA